MPDEKTTTQKVLKIGRWIALLYTIVYLVGVNLFLNLNFSRPLINRKPEKILLEWDRAWTILPGFFHLRGFRIRGQTRRQQWDCRLDSGSVGISPLALTGKKVRISSADGSGIGFSLRKRLTPEEIDAEWVQHTPDIEGLSNPPDPAPEDIYPRKKKKRRWLIDLSGLDFRGPVDVWMGRLRITGNGRVGGGFHYQLGGELQIPESFLDLEEGEVTIDGDVMTSGFHSDIDLQMTPFNPKEVKGKAALGHVFGDLALADGHVPDLRALDPFLPASSGLELTGGTGEVDIRGSRGLDDEASHGVYDLSVNDARLLLAGEELTASLKLHASFYGGLAHGFYHLEDSTLSLEDVILADPGADEKKEEQPQPPWWAKLTVKEGNVLLKKPVDVAAFVDMELESTRPLLHLFFSRPRPDKDNPEEEAKKPKWINRIPDIQNVEGSAYIAIDDRGLLLDDMVVSGDKLDLLARLKGRKGDMDGQVYLRYGILHLGVGLDDGKKNFKIIKPRKWFLEQPDLDDTRTIEPPDAPEGLEDGG